MHPGTTAWELAAVRDDLRRLAARDGAAPVAPDLARIAARIETVLARPAAPYARLTGDYDGEDGG
jgi:hypothetical protein